MHGKHYRRVSQLDRKKKEKELRDNMERALKRSEMQWQNNFGTEMPKERREYEREEFRKAAVRVDKGKLHEIKNDRT